jgi:hypothetical protein
MIVIEDNISARSIESQSGIRFEGCSAIVSTLHQGVYAEGPLHRGRPANVERIAFRWPLYADELRACVNHFTNLEGLSLSRFGGISVLAARRGCEKGCQTEAASKPEQCDHQERNRSRT